MEKIISLCKRRGFIYPGSEIYGGLAGTYDYGPLGVALKNNIKKVWWKRFVDNREDMYGMDAAIIMNPEVWRASGHVGGFSDPLSECKECKHRFRTDHLSDKEICPDCGGRLSEPKQFNMMFETYIGPVNPITDVYNAFIDLINQNRNKWDRNNAEILMKNLDNAKSYLRPETAGGMFVNFKNIYDSVHPKLPFGMAQIGKAFRNEIAPRDFIFRTREFEQMEIEYFVKPDTWQDHFEKLRVEMHGYMNDIGLSKEHVHEIEVSDEDRAFYSKRTIDIEFDFPFGQKELYGLAYRTDYDLTAHQNGSKKDLTYFDEETKERFIPHVIEPSFGVDRTVLAVLSDAYTEDTLGGDTREYLKLNPSIAPYIACVSPLLKNKQELKDTARDVFMMLKKEFGNVAYDDNGNVGKRYRRQDEIGTPYCIVIDFDTTGTGENTDSKLKDTVTIRHRDTGMQERVAIDSLISFIRGK